MTKLAALSIRRALFGAASAATWVALPLSAQPNASPVFSIRVDLSVAEPINRVLASIAKPQVVILPHGTTQQDYLARMCGARAPTEISAGKIDDTGTLSIRFVPCVRQSAPRRLIGRGGDKLEVLAVRLGMRPSAANQLRVLSPEGKARPPSAVYPGDTILTPPAPAWTTFTVASADVKSRADLVAIVAKAIGCGRASPETCLRARSVIVIEHDRREARIVSEAVDISAQQRAPASAPLPDRKTGLVAFPVTERLLSQAARAPVSQIMRSPSANFASASVGPTQLVSPSATTLPAPSLAPSLQISIITAADYSNAPVAPDQWPYDLPLVRALMTEALAHLPEHPVVIGVIDEGLGSPVGAPLPRAIFVNTLEPGAPNGIDEDGDEISDNIVGEGIRRSDEALAESGDVSACPGPTPDYATLDAGDQKVGSHGTIVSSVAAGLALRGGQTTFDGLLPKIQFFRLARNLCSSDVDDQGTTAITAINYFVNSDAKIINLSALLNGSAGAMLRSTIEDLAKYPMPLLVVSAGDYTSDLDKSQPCPPCIGLDGMTYARGLLVVGAATRDLRRADYSGYGDQTVRIYAPGEPLGAIDIRGLDASGIHPYTSYATPLVSLAAALLRSFGIDDTNRLRNRLLLSTWSLFNANGSPVGKNGGPIDVGVLDLLKVVAVHHQAVEILEPKAGGGYVRRTYVGQITGGLEGVCPGLSMSESAVQLIRLPPPDATGARNFELVMRQMVPHTRDLVVRFPPPCYPVGSLTMETIGHSSQTLPLAAVTQILFAAH